MSKFTLAIDLGNASMRTGADVAAALRKAADEIEPRAPGVVVSSGVWDKNGNRVGKWSLDLPEEAHDVTRYAVTHVNKDGVRTLTFANQGRHHFDDRQKAEDWIAACRQDPRSLASIFEGRPDTFEVREVECYGHGDAKRLYFDE